VKYADDRSFLAHATIHMMMKSRMSRWAPKNYNFSIFITVFCLYFYLYFTTTIELDYIITCKHKQFCSRLNSFLRRCDKLGYMEKHYVDISTIFEEADDALFRTILSNKSHVLYTYLSKRPEISYSLRTRNHNKFLIPKASDLGDRHFIIRMLYENLY